MCINWSLISCNKSRFYVNIDLYSLQQLATHFTTFYKTRVLERCFVSIDEVYCIRGIFWKYVYIVVHFLWRGYLIWEPLGIILTNTQYETNLDVNMRTRMLLLRYIQYMYIRRNSKSVIMKILIGDQKCPLQTIVYMYKLQVQIGK